MELVNLKRRQRFLLAGVIISIFSLVPISSKAPASNSIESFEPKPLLKKVIVCPPKRVDVSSSSKLLKGPQVYNLYSARAGTRLGTLYVNKIGVPKMTIAANSLLSSKESELEKRFGQRTKSADSSLYALQVSDTSGKKFAATLEAKIQSGLCVDYRIFIETLGTSDWALQKEERPKGLSSSKS
jgi:hypothetical protein